jgi:hypothetical protein
MTPKLGGRRLAPKELKTVAPFIDCYALALRATKLENPGDVVCCDIPFELPKRTTAAPR